MNCENPREEKDEHHEHHDYKQGKLTTTRVVSFSCIDAVGPTSANLQREPKMRQVTESPRWTADVSAEKQMALVDSFFVDISGGGGPCKERRNMEQQIRAKLRAYKYQDEKKGVYAAASAAALDDVVGLLRDCRLLCHYCRLHVSVLYDVVRDRCQWTLDRLNNNFGHNRDNVVVACLECNLRRRTKFHKRFEQEGHIFSVKLTGSGSGIDK
jgi:5-methylcytosine-specific restriction endonuclease McrA